MLPEGSVYFFRSFIHSLAFYRIVPFEFTIMGSETETQQPSPNTSSERNEEQQQQQHDALMDTMEKTRKKWIEEDGDEADDTDRLLQEAIQLAVEQGRGWAPGEKEEYMAKIMDDDFIPPIFAESAEELERSGLAEAFSTLLYDDSPVTVMLEFKKKGTEAFMNGKRNQASNVQYYRDAINHYYQAFAWAQKIEPLEHKEQNRKEGKEPEKKPGTDETEYTEAELDEIKSNLYSNAALAHMQLKNWGFVRNDCKKVSQPLLVERQKRKSCTSSSICYCCIRRCRFMIRTSRRGIVLPSRFRCFNAGKKRAMLSRKDLLSLVKQRMQTSLNFKNCWRSEYERRVLHAKNVRSDEPSACPESRKCGSIAGRVPSNLGA